jgi:Fe-S-cluster containining protein
MEEFYKIADFLKLTPEKTLKKYFVVDALGEGDSKFVFPAKSTQLDITGTYVPWDRTYDEGYCCFYDEKKFECKIYPVRPVTARNVECWVKDSEEQDKRQEELMEKAIVSWADFDFENYGIEIEDDDY